MERSRERVFVSKLGASIPARSGALYEPYSRSSQSCSSNRGSISSSSGRRSSNNTKNNNNHRRRHCAFGLLMFFYLLCTFSGSSFSARPSSTKPMSMQILVEADRPIPVTLFATMEEPTCTSVST